MLEGPRVALRARTEADVEVLHRELYDDVEAFSRLDGRAWRPHPLALGSPFAPTEPAAQVADFTAVLRASDEVLGRALLWHIDLHNRSAHVGLALRPAFRGKGYGTECVGLLCHYAFVVLGLHRLQMETLADNAAMIGAGTKCGFRHEGTTRDGSWVAGAFVDDVVYGLLADEWTRAVP